MSNAANNNNQISRPIRAIDEPPQPKRPRTSRGYADFTNIISKLSKKYDAKLLACFVYEAGLGVFCETCSSDKKLKGPFTKAKPCKYFSYTKFKDHLLTDKHYNRMPNDETKSDHPNAHIARSIAQKQSQNGQIPNHLNNALDKIINAVSLLHLLIKNGVPLNKLQPFSKFYDDGFIDHSLSSSYYADELIDAMNEHQTKIDIFDVLGGDKSAEFSLALDGSTRRTRTMKIFDMKGWKKSVGPITKYCIGLDGKKSIQDLDIDLTDLFSSDTGNDNLKQIEQVVTEHLGVGDWKQLQQLAYDGASQNNGRWQGCGVLTQRKHNKFMETIWGMTHRANLLAKNGWKNIEWVQRLFNAQQTLYRTFSEKNIKQLYDGICFTMNERCLSQKSDSETRFNSHLIPTQNIRKSLKAVCQTLKHIVKEKAECKNYYRAVNNHRNNIGEAPVKPSLVIQHDYWLNLTNIVSNYAIELVLRECEFFGNSVGACNVDIVSNHAQIDELETKLTSFNGMNLRDFKVKPQEENGQNNGSEILNNDEMDIDDAKIQYYPSANPIDHFLKNFSFEDNRQIVRFGNVIFWRNVNYNELNDLFKTKVRQLTNGIIQQIPHYFKSSVRELWRQVAMVFDPKKFKVYSSLNAAANHAINEVDHVLDYFKVKRFDIAPNVSSTRRYIDPRINKEKFKVEYHNLRRILYQNKNIYPKSLSNRLLAMALILEEKKNIFAVTYYVLRRILTLFSGVIDIERQNGIKKWFMNARREAMDTMQLDKLLRIYCNSPSRDEKEAMALWLREVVKIFWMASDRRIDCKELDIMCGKNETN